MYAILSLLRRFSGSVVYVEPGARIDLPATSKQLNLSSEEWVSQRGMPMYELAARAPTAALAAQKLALKENEIAVKIGAQDRRYTLILGPEEQEVIEEGVVRKTHLAVVDGLYRYEQGVVSRLRRKNASGSPAKRRRRTPPKGALVERR